MALSSTGLLTNCEALLNYTRTLQPDKLHCITEGRNIFLKKKLIKRYLKQKMKMMHPNHGAKPFLTSVVPISMVTSVNSPYCYEQDYSYPIAVSDWNGFQSPVLAIHPAPVILPRPSPIFGSHIIPLTGIVQPVITPIVPVTQAFVPEDITSMSKYIHDYNFFAEPTDDVTFVNENTHYIHVENVEMKNKQGNDNGIRNNENQESEIDPIEAYLILPKELFPTARMMTLDPNPIIDELCTMPNVQRHMPWLLDLEFGIPKSPITRPIPIYNVKFNSIHCKNTPDAIHPGFESCGPDFKRALLFYYDCIVSAWYRGYVIMKCDQSVENFQSWLLLPMQVLGMCWP